MLGEGAMRRDGVLRRIIHDLVSRYTLKTLAFAACHHSAYVKCENKITLPAAVTQAALSTVLLLPAQTGVRWIGGW